jgi:hypothetical protein
MHEATTPDSRHSREGGKTESVSGEVSRNGQTRPKAEVSRNGQTGRVSGDVSRNGHPVSFVEKSLGPRLRGDDDRC